MSENTRTVGTNVGISFKLSCIMGESINAKFLRACAAEFVASFALVWMIACVSSAIGYLPIPKDITAFHMMSTTWPTGMQSGSYEAYAYNVDIGSSDPAIGYPQGIARDYPQSNIPAKYGPVGGVLNALKYETGMQFGFDRTIGYALVYGLGLAFLSYCIVDLSGAHINPVVSLALAISGNCTWLRAFFYWFFQCGGAIAGAGWLKLSVGPTFYLGGLLYYLPVEPGRGWLLEFWGTVMYILPYLFFAPWSARTFEMPWKLGTSIPSSLGPLVVGLSLAAASICIHPFTGCALNPARALGTATFEQRRTSMRTGYRGTRAFAIYGFPRHWWIYWIGPLGAAVVVPLVYIAIVGTASNVDPFRVNMEGGLKVMI